MKRRKGWAMLLVWLLVALPLFGPGSGAPTAHAAGGKIALTTLMVTNESGIGDATKLVDQQDIADDPKGGHGGTNATGLATTNQWNPGYDNTGYPLYAYIDLGQQYDLTDIYLYDTYAGGDVSFYSGSPGNWSATPLFTDPLSGYMSWNGHALTSVTTRYLRVKLHVQAAAMAEIVLYGSPVSGGGDTTAPAQVTTLAAGNPTASSLALTWTAPGDDGGTGTATSYDIRYSTNVINAGNWASATPASGEPAPAAAGTSQSFTVTGLAAGTLYYFALKTTDEAGNVSALSNVPYGTTSANSSGGKIALTTLMVTNESGVGDATKLVDQQNVADDPKGGHGGTNATGLATTNQWNPGYDNTGYPLFAYVDLGQQYDLTDIYLYDTYASGDVSFYSGSPGNWSATPLFTDPLSGYMSWNGHALTNVTTRYLRVKLHVQAAAMAEIVLYGSQAGGSDITAPAQVTTLAASNPTASSLTLTWTAPGDDGGTGTATSYDIRYSTGVINAGNWASATPASGEPAPAAAGTSQSFTVTGLGASTTYYFALKTADEAGNVSVLSNVPNVATSAAAASGKIALAKSMATSENGKGDAGKLIDEQTLAGDPKAGGGSSGLTTSGQWEPGYNTSDYPASAYIDLRQSYNISDIYLYDTYAAGNMTISIGSPGNWTPLFTDPLSGYMTWSGHQNLNAATRYIRVTMQVQSAAMAELVLYGSRVGADTVVPGTVTNLAAGGATSSSLTLTWTAPGNDLDTGTAASYDIRYSKSPINAGNFAGATQAAGEPAPTAVGTSQSFTATGLSPNTKYYWALKTVDEAGNASAISNVPSGKTAELPDTTDPGAVTDLAVGGATPASLLLTWTAPGDDGNTGRAASYDIRYSTSPISSGNFAGATPATGEPAPAAAGASESFLLTGLSAGTTYYFALKTSDEASHVSAISNLPHGSTGAASGDTTAPSAITDLKLGYASSDSINLSWTTTGDDGSVGMATAYDIRYSKTSITNDNFAGATQVSRAPVPYTAHYGQAQNVTGLAPNTTYYFAVKAMDEAGRLSALSNVASATTGSDQDGSKIILDPTMTFNEIAYGDPAKLVDEQAAAGDPKNGTGGSPSTDYFVGDHPTYYPGSVVIDLGADYHLTDIYMYDTYASGNVKISYGTPGNWQTLFTDPLSGYFTWTARTVDATTRYLRYQETINTSLPEIVVYGTRVGAMQPPSPPQPTIPNPSTATPMDQFIGMNAFIDDPIDKMQAAGFVREYHTWGWDTYNDIGHAYPNNLNKFNPSFGGVPGWNFDKYYQDLKNAGLFVFPTIQQSVKWLTPDDNHHKPLPAGANPEIPASYIAHADHMFQYAARYGSTVVADNKLKLETDQPRSTGLNTLKYYENWNEQNATWPDDATYFTPYQYAAMSSADYDGHLGTMPNTVGLKNADPNAKLVMAGTAGLQPEYLKAMKYWADWNRGGSFPADVINFHLCACTGTSGGIGPEAFNTKQQVEDLVRYRNTYLPGKEIWITEFGYDTHPYSVQAAPAIGPNDNQEVQGQWLVRTYLALAAAGVDRAAMYMLRDVYETPNPEFWATSGLTTSKEDGWVPKKSWYYVYTLKNALAGLHYVDEQPSGNANVWIYRFADNTGTIRAYALWSPTTNNTTVSNYQLSLAGSPSTATLVTMQTGSTTGVSSSLTIAGGKVGVNVSERPVFVKVN
ncbi:MAG: fibronectin type III domain-containing protein [Paenibacillaceae bacterium]|nr:fibronectin type III domain-containing protein [Paenibacillaceae bacterium]